ncbi:hypothetical protein EK904_002845 [Melospiza melodia maxima]|nr:hypothetical protein EK904_002845 [Melospiza melodia maxima]
MRRAPFGIASVKKGKVWKSTTGRGKSELVLQVYQEEEAVAKSFAAWSIFLNMWDPKLEAILQREGEASVEGVLNQLVLENLQLAPLQWVCVFKLGTKPNVGIDVVLSSLAIVIIGKMNPRALARKSQDLSVFALLGNVFSCKEKKTCWRSEKIGLQKETEEALIKKQIAFFSREKRMQQLMLLSFQSSLLHVFVHLPTGAALQEEDTDLFLLVAQIVFQSQLVAQKGNFSERNHMLRNREYLKAIYLHKGLCTPVCWGKGLSSFTNQYKVIDEAPKTSERQFISRKGEDVNMHLSPPHVPPAELRAPSGDSLDLWDPWSSSSSSSAQVSFTHPAASPRDQLQSQHCVTVSSCDRLAYFWKSVPTLSLLEEKSKLSLKINPFGRGAGSFRQRSALGLGLRLCQGRAPLVSRAGRALHLAWHGSPALELCKNPSALQGTGSRVKYSMELHGCCPHNCPGSCVPIAELALRRESSARVVPVTVLGVWNRAENIHITAVIPSHGSDSGAAEIWGVWSLEILLILLNNWCTASKETKKDRVFSSEKAAN